MKNSGSCSLFVGCALCFGLAASGVGVGVGGGLGGGGGGGLFVVAETSGGCFGRLGYSLLLTSRSSESEEGTWGEGCGEEAADCGEGGAHIALSHAGAALPSRLATHCCIRSAGLPLTSPTTCAGDPATAVRGGTGFSTREPAATCAPRPTVMLPRIVAAAPTRTLSSIFGWRSPAFFPVPPRVTFWRIETLSPTTAVSCCWTLFLSSERKRRRRRRRRRAGKVRCFLIYFRSLLPLSKRKEKTRKKGKKTHPNHDPGPVVQQQPAPQRRRRVDVDGKHLGYPRLEHAGHDPRRADAALFPSSSSFVVGTFVIFAPLSEPELVRDAVNLHCLIAFEVEQTVGVGSVGSKVVRRREKKK